MGSQNSDTQDNHISQHGLPQLTIHCAPNLLCKFGYFNATKSPGASKLFWCFAALQTQISLTLKTRPCLSQVSPGNNKNRLKNQKR